MCHEGDRLEFYEVVKKRSVIRDFKPDPIPEDVVRRILEAGIRAPSGEHKQPWEFIWVKNPELRKELTTLKFESRKRMAKALFPDLSEQRILELANLQKTALETAPVLIAVCYTNFDNPTEMGKRGISMSHAQTWQCIQNMWLAATAEGLGFSPTFYPDDVYDQATKLLGLPQGVELAAIARIGRKNQNLKRKPIKSLEEKLHYDKF